MSVTLTAGASQEPAKLIKRPQTDRQTDRQTDGLMDRQTKKAIL